MKKKYLFVSLLAAAATLVSCGEKEVKDNLPNSEQTDQKPTEEVCHHVDVNHDHKCDLCDEQISQHLDYDGDHICDTCKAKISEHSDNNSDHKCDLCEEVISECVDKDGDLKCDICGAAVESGESGGGEGEGEGDDNIDFEELDVPTVFEDCMKHDYSNMTALCEEVTGYEATLEGYEATGYLETEYYLGDDTYLIFDETNYSLYADSGYPLSYFFYEFADFDGKNYQYLSGSWADEEHTGHPYAGYVQTNQYDINISMPSLYFYMPNLLSGFTQNDFTYSYGTFIVKPESMAKFNEKVLGYQWDIQCTVAGIDINKDKDGHFYFSKIKAYQDPENDRTPYIVIALNNIGETVVPYGAEAPVKPTAENTFEDYYSMSGQPRKVDILIDELKMEAYDNVKYRLSDEDYLEKYGKSYAESPYVAKSSLLDPAKLYAYKDGKFYETGKAYEKDPAYAEYDIVLHENETIDINLFVGPEDYNKEGLTEWRYTGDTKVQNSLSNDGVYPTKEEGFVGAFDYINDTKINEATESERHVHRHKWFTAVNAGEIELWATHSPSIAVNATSNKLKVKVLPAETSTTDLTNVAYGFHFTSSNRVQDDPADASSAYWRTEFAATNVGDPKFQNPDYEIIGMRSKLLEAKYTEAYSSLGEEQLLYIGVGDQTDYQSSDKQYVEFRLGDQEINKISFDISLHRSNQAINYSNLKEAYIEYSNDGVTFTQINLQKKLVNYWKDVSSRGDMPTYHYETTLKSNAKFVRFVFKNEQIGKMLGIVFANIRFLADETCANHVPHPYVDVSGLNVSAVGLSSDVVSIAEGKTVTVTANVEPANATNKRVWFTSANPGIVKVNQKGELTGVKTGVTTVKVYSDYMNADEEHFEKVITVIVGERDVVPQEANGTYMNSTVMASVTINAKDSLLVVNMLKFNEKLYSAISLSLDSKDGSTYIFVSPEENLTIKVTFAADYSSLTIVEMRNSSETSTSPIVLTK